jgi:hypothetical protein
MTAFVIVFSIQLLATVVALVREPRQDHRFDGDKLIYRS